MVAVELKPVGLTDSFTSADIGGKRRYL